MNFVGHFIFVYMIETVFGNTLLYKINNKESIYVTNKSRGIIHQPKSELIENDGDMISLVYANDRYVLVGQVDKIYNISSAGDFEKILIENKQTVMKIDCTNAYDCKNYIRAAFTIEQDKNLVTCGTTDLQCQFKDRLISNLSPKQLIQYKVKNNNIAPFTYANSVYFFHSTTKIWDMFKQEYAFNGIDVVFKEVIRLPAGAIKGPNFRSSFGFEDKVYMFFSESEIKHQKEIIYKTFESYIGEVCAEDSGKNANDLIKRFVSFKKTNINCYLPDYSEMAHTKYSEIQQVTRPIEKIDENTGKIDYVFYAVFTTRRSNEIDSAVCMFELSSVKRSMSGMFKNDQDKNPLRPLESCSEYKKQTPSQIDVYAKSISRHSKYEMDESLNRRAFLALKNTKFSSIATHFQHKEHILYIGTAEGRLLKLITKPSNIKGHPRPIILSDLKIFNNESIVNIIVSDRIITLIGETQIRRLKIEHFCEKMSTCAECVHSEDPDCSWTVKGCVLKQLGYEEKKCLISRFDFVVGDKQDPEEQRSSFSSIFVTFLFTFVFTSIMTCIITYYIIKINYKLIEKPESDGENVFLDFFKSRNFRQTISVKKKLLKCYETQPVVCVGSRPESTSDSPFILTSCSPSSTESNSPNYPNNKDLFIEQKQFKDSNLIRIC